MRLLAPRSRVLVAVGAATVLVAALLIIFRDPLTQAVALPAAWIAWAFRSASVAVGQRIGWWLFIIAFSGAAFGAVRAARPTGSRPAPPERTEGIPSRLAHWESVVSLDSGNTAGRAVLVLELRALALSVLSRTEGLESGAMQRRLETVSPDLPSCLHDLFADTWLGQAPGRRSRAEPSAPLPLSQILEALETRLLGAKQASRNER